MTWYGNLTVDVLELFEHQQVYDADNEIVRVSFRILCVQITRGVYEICKFMPVSIIADLNVIVNILLWKLYNSGINNFFAKL